MAALARLCYCECHVTNPLSMPRSPRENKRAKVRTLPINRSSAPEGPPAGLERGWRDFPAWSCRSWLRGGHCPSPSHQDTQTPWEQQGWEGLVWLTTIYNRSACRDKGELVDFPQKSKPSLSREYSLVDICRYRPHSGGRKYL